MRRSNAPQMPKVDYELIQFGGGMDLTTPTLGLKPGIVRDALNFEASSTGGYSRIAGIERFNGMAAPSAATYIVLNVINVSSYPTVNTVVNGASSGATGYIAYTDTTRFVIVVISGSFSGTENIRVGTTVVATSTSTGSGATPKESAQFLNYAANVYRTLITAPTGSGPIRGVFMLNDNTYCFRDNAGATTCNLWQATASGWTQIPYLYTVSFTTGNVAIPADGATLTQGGVTATVRRVCTRSGAWTGSAAGAFVITAPTGGNFSAAAATLTGGATVNLTGAQTSIASAILPGGTYEFDIGNFTGRAGTQRVYGVDGKNPAFEFDGATYVPLPTGTSPDTPSHVQVHKNYLMVSVLSSLVISGLATPYNWTSTAGAVEIAVGETVTGLIVLPGNQSNGALGVFTQDTTSILYGTSSTTWNLVSYNTGTGALPYTLQNFNQTYVLDSRGVMSLQASLNYGNFDQTALTANIRSFIDSRRNLIACSCLCRAKNQYRLFFKDGYALYLTVVNDKYLGAMPVSFGNLSSNFYANVAWEGQKSNGAEIMYIGGSDGQVYQVDVGTSLDGNSIYSYLTFTFDMVRSPRILKRFRKAALEVYGSTYAEVQVGYSLGYGSLEIPQQSASLYSTSFTAGNWDSGTWDTLVWDGQTLLPTEVEMTGTGENVAFQIISDNNFSGSFTLNSMIVHYSIRRGMR